MTAGRWPTPRLEREGGDGQGGAGGGEGGEGYQWTRCGVVKTKHTTRVVCCGVSLDPFQGLAHRSGDMLDDFEIGVRPLISQRVQIIYELNFFFAQAKIVNNLLLSKQLPAECSVIPQFC